MMSRSFYIAFMCALSVGSAAVIVYLEGFGALFLAFIGGVCGAALAHELFGNRRR